MNGFQRHVSQSEVAAVAALLLLGMLLGGCGGERRQGNTATGGGHGAGVDDPFAQGVACENSGDWERAFEQFTRVIETDPRRTEAYVHRAEVSKALGRHDRARADYDAAIGIAPDDPQLYMHRAVLHQV